MKDRRVTHIENFDSNSFIIAGERVDQKKIWVAQLRTADGSILWLKEYKIGHKHSTYDLCIQNNIIYVLGEMRRLVPISIEKNYKKRRIVFFQKLSLRSLVLLSISKNGDLIRKSNIDPKKKYFNYKCCLKVNTNEKIMFARFIGYYKKGKEWVEDDGFALYRINSKDKITSKLIVDANNLLLSENDLIFSETNYESDVLKIKKLSDSQLVLIDSIKMPFKDIRIESLLKTDNLYYLSGSIWTWNYLICSMNNEYLITDFRKYERDKYSHLVKLIETYDGNLMIVGWCYGKNKKTGYPYTYMNLVKCKKFGP